MKNNIIPNKHIADLYRRQQQQTEKLKIEKFINKINFSKKNLTFFAKYNII